MDRLAFVALWLLVFVIPFENAFVIPGLGTLGRIVGFFALVIGLLATLSRHTKIRIGTLHWLTLSFVLLAGFSFYWSVDPDATLKRLWTYVQLLAMMWLIWQWADNEKKVLQLFQAFGLGTLALAAGMFAGLGSATAGVNRLDAYNFNPNDIASILALGIPICWYAGLRNKNFWVSKLYMAIPAILVVAILLTGSRAGLVKAILAFGLIFWSLTEGSNFRRLLILCSGALIISIVLTVVPTRTLTRLGTTTSEIGSGTLGGRTEIWAVGMEIFYENPLLGIGAGNFRTVVGNYFMYDRAPHNVFLAILVEQGIIGLGAFLFILGAVFHYVLKTPPRERMFLLTLMAIWVATALTSNWEWRKQTWLLLALIAAHADMHLLKPKESTVKICKVSPSALLGETR
jgi:O-antigen ligase